jgi:hypothetical protein
LGALRGLNEALPLVFHSKIQYINLALFHCRAALLVSSITNAEAGRGAATVGVIRARAEEDSVVAERAPVEEAVGAVGAGVVVSGTGAEAGAEAGAAGADGVGALASLVALPLRAFFSGG